MRLLWSSDHHTLHANTPTKHILANLDTFLLKDHDLAVVDMVIFGGDFFERMVERPNRDMYSVEEWATNFFRRCYEHDVRVIFLEGTSSHDRGQPAHLKFNAPEGMKFEYVDTLCIKTYPEFDNFSIMFVPDNMGKATPAEIWEKALEVLVATGLEKVNLIAFHGAFEFQLHSAARHKAHILELWESIVEYLILAGHIHTPVRVGKLCTSGSFDRTRHGEEHPKGGYVVDFDLAKKTFNAVFYENKKALPYVTMQVGKESTPEELIKAIHHFIRDRQFPHGSHLRLFGGIADIVNPVVAVLIHEYPHIHIKAENEVHKDVLLDEELFDGSVYEGVSITPGNLEEALFPEIKDALTKEQISEDEVRELLKEFK